MASLIIKYSFVQTAWFYAIWCDSKFGDESINFYVITIIIHRPSANKLDKCSLMLIMDNLCLFKFQSITFFRYFFLVWFIFVIGIDFLMLREDNFYLEKEVRVLWQVINWAWGPPLLIRRVGCTLVHLWHLKKLDWLIQFDNGRLRFKSSATIDSITKMAL